ncbi:MAG: DedA family protein [Leuconostoc pseudomesenteroides]|uniref:DedA family protein n=1 Tax=Leuconostoc pseudomesenteroides TaxID=33968 RepID=UPI001E3050F7|nr:DedA family protein [Leuconostoc pseudomesenteroides]MCC7668505.1 alkaline phosphatase [Leuconostoc pseudomesenteroides]
MFLNSITALPNWLDHLIASDHHFTLTAFAIMFALIFIETAGIVTGFIPGDTILITVGSLAGVHHNIWELFLAIGIFAIASFLGDAVNYWLGALITTQVAKIPWIKKYSHSNLTDEIAKDFHPKRWLLFVVLGRFLPFIRVAVPLLAHRLGLAFPVYLRMAAFASVLWSASIVSIGYFVGHLEIPKAVTVTIFIIIAVIAITVLRTKKFRNWILTLFTRK